MIKVNLLPVKRKKKAKVIPPFLIYGVLLTIVTGIVAVYVFWWMNSQMAALREQKKKNEATIADLNNKIKEVKNFEEQKKMLEQKTGIIEQLKKNQSLPARILTEMKNVLPDGVWINSMSVAGGNINISGEGFTNEDVVNYVDNLKKSPMLTDVYLHGTQKAAAGAIVTYQFSLTCRVKGEGA